MTEQEARRWSMYCMALAVACGACLGQATCRIFQLEGGQTALCAAIFTGIAQFWVMFAMKAKQ